MYSRNSGIAVSSQLDVSQPYASSSGLPLPPTGHHEYPVPGMPIGAPRDYRIWNPPPSSYADDEDAPTPPPETAAQREERRQADEWRRYPEFPSAYPSTPYVPSKLSLSSDGPMQKMPLAPSSFAPLQEEEEGSYASPAPSGQQDFHKSLLPAREPSDPSSSDSLSDEYREPGVQHLPAAVRERSSESNNEDESSSMEVDTSDVEDGEEEEEDSFNMTLKTPLHPSGSIRVRSRFGELSTSSPPMSNLLAGLHEREGSSSSSDSVADRHHGVSTGQKRRHLSDSLSADESDARSGTQLTDDDIERRPPAGKEHEEEFIGETTIRPAAAAEAHSRSTSGTSDAISMDSSDMDTTSSSNSNNKRKSGRSLPEAKKRRVAVVASSSKIPTATRRTRSTAAAAAKAQAGPTPARKARERVMRATRQASRSRSTTTTTSASTGSRASSRGGLPTS